MEKKTDHLGVALGRTVSILFLATIGLEALFVATGSDRPAVLSGKTFLVHSGVYVQPFLGILQDVCFGCFILLVLVLLIRRWQSLNSDQQDEVVCPPAETSLGSTRFLELIIRYVAYAFIISMVGIFVLWGVAYFLEHFAQGQILEGKYSANNATAKAVSVAIVQLNTLCAGTSIVSGLLITVLVAAGTLRGK